MTCVAGKALSPALTMRGPKNSWKPVRSGLARDAARDATRQEVETINREDTELKHLVVDFSLEAFRLNKTLIAPLRGEKGAV